LKKLRIPAGERKEDQVLGKWDAQNTIGQTQDAVDRSSMIAYSGISLAILA
jgi:hypothetical protein